MEKWQLQWAPEKDSFHFQGTIDEKKHQDNSQVEALQELADKVEGPARPMKQ